MNEVVKFDELTYGLNNAHQLIDGDHYQKYIDEIASKIIGSNTEDLKTMKGFKTNAIPKWYPLLVWDNDSNMWHTRFTEDIRIPTITTECGKEVWMSLTPMEIITCRDGYLNKSGHVLVGGLGIGFVTLRLLEQESVTKVTVYEIDNEIIDLIGSKLKEQFGDKIEFVNDSIYNADPNEYDFISIDIHIQYGNADYDQELHKAFPTIKDYDEKFWVWGFREYDENTTM